MFISAYTNHDTDTSCIRVKIEDRYDGDIIVLVPVHTYLAIPRHIIIARAIIDHYSQNSLASAGRQLARFVMSMETSIGRMRSLLKNQDNHFFIEKGWKEIKQARDDVFDKIDLLR